MQELRRVVEELKRELGVMVSLGICPAGIDPNSGNTAYVNFWPDALLNNFGEFQVKDPDHPDGLYKAGTPVVWKDPTDPNKRMAFGNNDDAHIDGGEPGALPAWKPVLFKEELTPNQKALVYQALEHISRLEKAPKAFRSFPAQVTNTHATLFQPSTAAEDKNTEQESSKHSHTP